MRVVVVGPGPVRPGVGPAASLVALDLASALAEAGHEVCALDASPASALLWPGAVARRYLEPLDVATLRRVVEVERASHVVALAAGPAVLRALTAEGDLGITWLGGAPRALVRGKRDLPIDAEGRILDAVVASDGRAVEVLAALECVAPAHVAVADGEHRVLARVPEGLAAEAARFAKEEGLVGLEALGFVEKDGRYEVLSADRVDTVLWALAGLARGVRPGALLGWLVAGETLATALDRAKAAPLAASARVPCFDFEPYPGVDRALGGVAKSLGATLVAPIVSVPSGASAASGASAKTAPLAASATSSASGSSVPRRVAIVGPGPVTAAEGAEAGAAVALAARAVARLGHEVVVLASREGTGAERFAARVHAVHGAEDVRSVLARESPSDVLLGFGAGEPLQSALAELGSDVKPPFAARARALEAGPPAPDAIELHVVVLSDGARGMVVGTFEHVERAAVHPHDAAAVFPLLAVDEGALRLAEDRAVALAPELGVRGLVTARFAVQRAIASLVGVSVGVTTHALAVGLALGVDLVGVAAGVALGGALPEKPFPVPRHVAVEEHVFPFAALGVSDTRLDRRPRSTGSVLALGESVARAYARALAAMGVSLRRPGAGGERAVLLAGAEEHAVELADVGRRLYALGFELVATEEAARWLDRVRVPHKRTADAADLVSRRGVVAAVATADAAASLRHAALVAGVTCFTTVDLIKVAVKALELDDEALAEVRALEDWVARG